MLKSVIILLTFILFASTNAQSLYFPPTVGSTWDTKPIATLGWDSTKVPQLYDYLASINSKAFIVLKDGKIVMEKYFDSFTQDSVWMWASAGKTLTAMAVGIAQQEGKLSIEDTVSKYLGLGWTSAPANKESLIKIKHLLTMTSGLNDTVGESFCDTKECLQYLVDAGTRWAYHTGAYTNLDGVITNSTGENLNSFVQSRIKSKTGITGIYFKTGYLNVFYSNPRSFARFGLLLLGKGKWNGTSVLTDTNYFSAMTNTSQQINKSYGYLTWLNGKDSYMAPQSQFVFPGPLCPHAPPDMFAALGKNGQLCNVAPSQNLVFIRMGNGDNLLVPWTMNDKIWDLLNKVTGYGTSVNEQISDAGKSILYQSYPNPIYRSVTENSIITIRYYLSVPGDVELELFNTLGKVVQVLNCENQGLGEHNLQINISNLSSGIYFYRLKSGSFINTKKIVIL